MADSGVRQLASAEDTLAFGAELGRELRAGDLVVLSGPLGGDQQIGARIAEEKVLAVFFFRDPLTAQPHEPDVSALVRLCDVHDIALATNPASAEALMLWLAGQVQTN